MADPPYAGLVSFGGDVIRWARVKAGLTQAALARRAGTHQSAIAKYESGARSPTVDTLHRIVRAAGFDLRIRVAEPDYLSETLDEVLERFYGPEAVAQGRAKLEEWRREALAEMREAAG